MQEKKDKNVIQYLRSCEFLYLNSLVLVLWKVTRVQGSAFQKVYNSSLESFSFATYYSKHNKNELRMDM